MISATIVNSETDFKGGIAVKVSLRNEEVALSTGVGVTHRLPISSTAPSRRMLVARAKLPPRIR